MYEMIGWGVFCDVPDIPLFRSASQPRPIIRSWSFCRPPRGHQDRNLSQPRPSRSTASGQSLAGIMLCRRRGEVCRHARLRRSSLILWASPGHPAGGRGGRRQLSHIQGGRESTPGSWRHRGIWLRSDVGRLSFAPLPPRLAAKLPRHRFRGLQPLPSPNNAGQNSICIRPALPRGKNRSAANGILGHCTASVPPKRFPARQWWNKCETTREAALWASCGRLLGREGATARAHEARLETEPIESPFRLPVSTG